MAIAITAAPPTMSRRPVRCTVGRVCPPRSDQADTSHPMMIGVSQKMRWLKRAPTASSPLKKFIRLRAMKPTTAAMSRSTVKPSRRPA